MIENYCKQSRMIESLKIEANFVRNIGRDKGDIWRQSWTSIRSAMFCKHSVFEPLRIMWRFEPKRIIRKTKKDAINWMSFHSVWLYRANFNRKQQCCLRQESKFRRRDDIWQYQHSFRLFSSNGRNANAFESVMVTLYENLSYVLWMIHEINEKT